jgi:hypothetical protein
MTAATTRKTRKLRAKSKSGIVRDYLKRRPDAGPTEVSAALKKKGISISPAHVSNVKATLRKAGESAAATSGAKTLAPVANGHIGRRSRKPARQGALSLSSLLEARKFAEKVGGLDRANELLDALMKLRG